jgi:flagellar assembly protein FliH
VESFVARLASIASLPNRSDGPAKPRRSASPEALRKQAQEEGFESGFAAGHFEGFTAGKQEGLEIGRAEGFEELMRLGRERTAAVQVAMEQLFSEIEEAKRTWFDELQQALTPYAIEIAERIVHKNLEIDRASCVAIVRQVMGQVEHATKARIRCRSEDAESIRAGLIGELQQVGALQSVQVVVDDMIEGGCVIETDGGTIDARTETQLASYRRALEEAA